VIQTDRRAVQPLLGLSLRAEHARSPAWNRLDVTSRTAGASERLADGCHLNRELGFFYHRVRPYAAVSASVMDVWVIFGVFSADLKDLRPQPAVLSAPIAVASIVASL
jgi:hypothetical protein